MDLNELYQTVDDIMDADTEQVLNKLLPEEQKREKKVGKEEENVVAEKDNVKAKNLLAKFAFNNRLGTNLERATATAKLYIAFLKYQMIKIIVIVSPPTNLKESTPLDNILEEVKKVETHVKPKNFTLDESTLDTLKTVNAKVIVEMNKKENTQIDAGFVDILYKELDTLHRDAAKEADKPETTSTVSAGSESSDGDSISSDDSSDGSSVGGKRRRTRRHRKKKAKKTHHKKKAKKTHRKKKAKKTHHKKKRKSRRKKNNTRRKGRH